MNDLYCIHMDTKTCSKCGNAKELHLFGSQKRGLLGKRSICRACVSTYNKKYSSNRYATDAQFVERVIKKAAEWAAKNPSKRAAIAKRRNQKALILHPDKIKARSLVNQRVRFGRMHKASECLCFRCGKQAAHYHHYLGYDFEHRYDVQPVCIACHLLLD